MTEIKKTLHESEVSSFDIARNETIVADIYVGFKGRESGIIFDRTIGEQIVRGYCNDVGLCVSITYLDYIYTNGGEPGAKYTLINYPRFPSTKEEIKTHGIKLSMLLLCAYHQMRVTMICGDETVMVTDKTRLPQFKLSI